MTGKLDATARATIARFLWNCQLALLIPLLFKADYLFVVSYCFLVAGWLKATIAFFKKQRFSTITFNHWSEALWLLFLAAGTRLASNNFSVSG
ncbi:hypothetical protein IB279_34995 [Ensifer sp. ENS06]|uniref:hypothetical protein n=1 Tax=Ensifer sp. ENS06 TaxID=2769276 RepID=UPI001780586D|nr:hypothetical protein [Ensifer sp. ENS06]MBD9628159.1 hypothetical protein [Ensifer sp. ENS06]